MSREELLAALDIAPTDAPIGMDDGQEHAPAPIGPPPSPTALDLDDWSMRRGFEALCGDVMGPILNKIDPDHPAPIDTAEYIAADCLAAAFEPTPKLAENCANETQGRYFRQLLETEAYKALHTDTQLDPLASELAAGHFAKGFLSLVETEQQQQQQRQESGQGPQSPADQQRQQMQQDIAALGAVSQALQNAAQDVGDLRDAQWACGDDPNGQGHIDAAALKDRFQRIRNSGMLRRIMQLAGRYRRLAQAKQRQKTIHGQDDIVGVELGADLARLCPSELAALADPDLEMDAMRRYLERGLMQRDQRGVEPIGRGPIVVIVDESGSMDGEPIATAKAFALAMAWIARHQKRWIMFVSFSSGPETETLAMPPNAWNQENLLDWLEHFYGGGTSCDGPLQTIPSEWANLGVPQGKTDVVLITDACFSVPTATARRYNAWKAQTQTKLYTLVIGEDAPGNLAQVSDRVWCLPNLDIDNEAIGEVMAI
jgi:uncharacterized protein with von Willebrand factor type A (vWA) domain